MHVKMTIIRTIQYLLLSLLFVGCSSAGIDGKLSEIESAMDSSPELALSALDSIAPTQLKSDSQRALFALLYSQALDKNYIDETNDSLICIAVRYFDRSDDVYHRMLAHYYHGRVQYNAKEFPQSLAAMMKALNASEEIDNYYWKGRIAEQIANIYDANFHGEDAIYYAHIAFDNLQKSGRQPYINYALLNLARIKGNNDKYGEAIKMAMQVADSAYLYADSYLLLESQDVLAANYVGMKDYTNAIDVFAELQKQKPLEDKQLSMYGISHLVLGNFEQANKIFDEIKQSKSNDDLLLTYQIYKARGDYESAIYVLNALFENLDSVLVSSMKQNFGQTLTEIHKEEQREREKEIKSAKTKQSATVGIGILVILIIITVFLYLHRNNKKKLEKNILIAQNLREILSIKERGLSEVTKSIRKSMEGRFKVIDNLCKTVYEYKATGLAKRKIAAEVENLIEQMSMDSQNISELERLVNENYSNILVSLKQDLPNLKNAD